MDDWSLLPSRNAVSEPAPYHQSPLSPTTTTSQSNARLDPPRQAPPAGAANLCPQAERLTRQAEPGNAAMMSGAEPRNPFYHQRISMITTPIPRTNVKNGQSPLDNTRPFMDDIGAAKGLASPAEGRAIPIDTMEELACGCRRGRHSPRRLRGKSSR
jgi:hypothetical protein